MLTTASRGLQAACWPWWGRSQVEDLDEMVHDIYGARGRARDRPPPEFD